MALRDSGLAQLSDSGVNNTSRTKKPPKKNAKQMKNYNGAYFNHTNFERAVIATNGRAPYTNKEVEVITQPNGFDPNSYPFKHNWMNNLVRSGSKSKYHNSTDVLGNDADAFNNSAKNNSATRGDMPSASVTATTIFQGMQHQDSGEHSLLNTD